MTQHPDTPTSQFTAVRWTFYRRLGLLLRTRLLPDGTTLSLHDIASRTGGFISADELAKLLAQGALAVPDALLCIKLAQALDVDPDYFVSDDAVADFVRAYDDVETVVAERDQYMVGRLSLQDRALALMARDHSAAVAAVADR